MHHTSVTPQVAKKHKTASSVKWNVPGIMGGNAVPGWEDQQGSIVRRIALFNFVKPVTRVDTLLPAKLLAEMPALVLKCNRAYRAAVRAVGSRNIWDVLPAYFRTTREEMAQIVNSMRGFLASESVQFDTTFYCPLAELRNSWTRWTQDQNISPKPRWHKDLYSGPLADRGLQLVKATKEYPRNGMGSRKLGDYVLGVDLSVNIQDDEENRCPNGS